MTHENTDKKLIEELFNELDVDDTHNIIMEYDNNRLVSLDLSSLSLIQLPCMLTKFSNLKTLIVNMYPLVEIPQCLHKLTSIELIRTTPFVFQGHDIPEKELSSIYELRLFLSDYLIDRKMMRSAYQVITSLLKYFNEASEILQYNTMFSKNLLEIAAKNFDNAIKTNLWFVDYHTKKEEYEDLFHVYQDLSELYVKIGNVDLGFKYYQKSDDVYQPKDADEWCFKATHYYHKSEYNLALDCFFICLELDINNNYARMDSDLMTIEQVIFAKYIEQLSQEKLQRIRDILIKFAQEYPMTDKVTRTSSLVQRMLGMFYECIGDMDSAFDFYHLIVIRLALLISAGKLSNESGAAKFFGAKYHRFLSIVLEKRRKEEMSREFLADSENIDRDEMCEYS